MRLALLLLLLSSLAQAAAPSSRYEALGDEVVRTVRSHFYDPARAAAWADKHAGYGREARSDEDFTRLTRAALAELQTSHTAYYPEDGVEQPQLRAIFGAAIKGPWRSPPRVPSLGVDFVERPEGYFARHVFAGGPAQKAGLLRGDRVLSADGKPFHPVRSLRAGRPVRLEVERSKGSAPLQLTLTPRRINPKEEWLQAQEKGSEVVQVGGKRVAYQHLFSCAGPEHQALLAETLQERFKDADALVVDFRDGWGGCNPEFVNLFNPLLPELRFTGRDGKVNSRSRRSAEACAHPSP
jgi:carboxyl-terminal processing protease